jgi:FkbM family methyltransferase
MLKSIARAARAMTRRFGADLVHYSFPRLIATARPAVVLDVGANAGQFGETLRAAGYLGRIASIEPLASAHALLQLRAAQDGNWFVAPRMALGAEAGEATINIAANSHSSSLLPMMGAHLAAAPHSKYVGEERVPVRRLDEVFDELVLGQRCLLKIDVQGFEAQVLAGARESLAKIVALQIEMSLIECYEGEAGFLELLADIRGRGFALHSITPAFTDTRTGQLLQADCFFVRQSGE